MVRALLAAVLSGVLASAGTANAADAKPQRLTTVNGVNVDLPWSAGWSVAADYPANPDTVAFRASAPGTMLVIITAAPKVPAGDVEAAMNFYLQQMIDDVKSRAVEKTVKPEPFAAGSRHAVHARATDREPRPGGFRFADLVVVMDGENPVIAKVQFNEVGRADAGRALAALSEVRIVRR